MEHGWIQVTAVDRQGGGIGKALIEYFKQARPDIATIALGTNTATTTNMIKGGTNDRAIGENAVAFNAIGMHILAGPIGILMPNGLLGKLTPETTGAISASDVVKVMIFSRRCSIRLADEASQSIKFYLETVAQIFREEIRALEGL